jgi:hypothetical protein
MSFETEDPQAQSGQTSFHVVSQGYFETMGIPVLRGRSFIDSDGPAARPVAVVSRSFERRYWTDGSAIGKGLTAERPGSVRTRFEIVGVVGDVRQLGLDDDPRAEWYVPSTQWGSGNPANEITFVVRPFAAPTLALEERAKAALRTVDPDLPVTTKTMAQLIATDTASPRFVLALMSVFACIAVALAAFGIYGVVSHAVARRSGELAVRLALGATRSGILALVVREHLEWVMGGILAGVLGARLSMRLLVSQLHGITPTDIPTYAAAALVIVVVAVLADIVPAWRTTRILPADVLRSE